MFIIKAIENLMYFRFRNVQMRVLLLRPVLVGPQVRVRHRLAEFLRNGVARLRRASHWQDVRDGEGGSSLQTLWRTFGLEMFFFVVIKMVIAKKLLQKSDCLSKNSSCLQMTNDLEQLKRKLLDK
jgi:hypothetical protein